MINKQLTNKKIAKNIKNRKNHNILKIKCHKNVKIQINKFNKSKKKQRKK